MIQKGVDLDMRAKRKHHIIWNEELRRLALFFGLIFAAALAIGNFGLARFESNLRREENRFFSLVLGSVTENYPDVDVDHVVQLLQEPHGLERGQALLAQYGFFTEGDGVNSFPGVEGQLSLMRVFFQCFVLLFAGGTGLLFFFYMRRRQARIEDLTAYMVALNRDEYNLEIEDNADDELSGLRNEIYKLTVFLKEQTMRALSQKKALADSVANISHQLKTPLTSMTILVDNLSENTDMDEETRHKFMREVSCQLSGMSWLVQTMLKISRLEAGVVALERKGCILRELVNDAVWKLETAAELAEVVFRVDVAGNISLRADHNWTVEAFLNLLKNAVEHSPKGGVVEIYGTENDVYTELRITDHGTGITGEERQRLFQRFYRGNTAKEDSTGIGLSLAKEIVERQNGYISVNSEENMGTEFSIKFLK